MQPLKKTFAILTQPKKSATRWRVDRKIENNQTSASAISVKYHGKRSSACPLDWLNSSIQGFFILINQQSCIQLRV